MVGLIVVLLAGGGTTAWLLTRDRPAQSRDIGWITDVEGSRSETWPPYCATGQSAVPGPCHKPNDPDDVYLVVHFGFDLSEHNPASLVNEPITLTSNSGATYEVDTAGITPDGQIVMLFVVHGSDTDFTLNWTNYHRSISRSPESAQSGQVTPSTTYMLRAVPPFTRCRPYPSDRQIDVH
jgi:hypothetical protein